VDGFIAAADHGLDWLHRDHAAAGDLEPDAAALHFESFLEQVGVLLMGRRTYDTVEQLGVWPYGDLPVRVATRRPLATRRASVTAVQGPIHQLIADAQRLAGVRDVYLDGGNLVQQALNAGLVDELTLTYVPLLLGQGIRLFDHLQTGVPLQFVAHRSYGQGMLQVVMRRR
jgi:dihydrofolate reductase